MDLSIYIVLYAFRKKVDSETKEASTAMLTINNSFPLAAKRKLSLRTALALWPLNTGPGFSGPLSPSREVQDEQREEGLQT